MKYIVTNVKITQVNQLTDTIFDFIVESEELSKMARVGQFIHIDCGHSLTLRRPISICEILDKGLRFIFDIRGKGTEKLSRKKVGDTINVLGPLGNSFQVVEGRALIVGGGIGVYPLLQLVKEHKNAVVSLGFKNKALITLEDDFRKYAKLLLVATDDGSNGVKGNALTNIKDDLEKGNYDVVYACGPLPMIKAIKEITDKYNILCEISLEERMACGIGACLCCPVKVEDDTELGFKHLHVCKDGPIFNAKEILL